MHLGLRSYALGLVLAAAGGSWWLAAQTRSGSVDITVNEGTMIALAYDSVAKTQKVSTNAANRSLCSDSEQLVDELHLRHSVALCHSPRSPLPDHFHRLDPPEGSPSRRHRSVPFGQPGPPLHISVILFNDIIQEFGLPQTATSPDGAFAFQVLNRRWISAVLIDVDDPRRQVAGIG